jgi:hypothetical protein
MVTEFPTTFCGDVLHNVKVKHTLQQNGGGEGSVPARRPVVI